MMYRLHRSLLAWLALCSAIIAPASAASPTEELEAKVAALTQSSQVTIVHFWAPWCSNCQAELKNGGWKNFATVNPDVNIVFVTVWHNEDGRSELAKTGLTELPNVQLFHHPNAARTKDEKMKSFLGTPVNWIPSTWIYRGGNLRYALNYGEVRFPLLQQLVRDAAAKW